MQIRGIADRTTDVGVPAGPALLNLVDAFLLGQGNEEDARKQLLDEIQEEGFVDAAAVFGNFEMMNRIAEGTGTPVPPQAVEREAEMMRQLGLHKILKGQQIG